MSGRRVHRLLECWAAVALAACGSSSVRFETVAAPAADFAAVKSVAVLPLVNHSASPEAAASVRAVLMKDLEAHAGLHVIEVPATAVDPTTVDRELARDIAKALGADAAVTGTVLAFGYVRGSARMGTPAVRLDLRLVDAAANVVWAARASGTDAPDFPQAGATLTSLTDEIARRLAQDLAGRRE